MQFSAFIFILIILMPSMIHSVVLRLMKIPLRISFSQPNLPVQLFILGILLPMPSYFFAVGSTRMFFDLDGLKPILYLIGILEAPNRDELIHDFPMWICLISIYYIFSLVMAFFLGLLFNWSETIAVWFEKISIIDEDKYANLQSNKVIVEVDVVTVDGQFIYSGKLGGGLSEIYFSQGTIVLSDVLKIPLGDGSLPIDEYKGILAVEGRLSSTSFLKKMIFPKNNISNINVRVSPKYNSTDVRFK